MDFASIAAQHVYKTLAKIKSIATHHAFANLAAPSPSAFSVSHDAAHSNVTARLYNSNPVKEAMQEVLNNIYGVLGLKGQELHPEKRLRAKDFNDENNVDSSGCAATADRSTDSTAHRFSVTPESSTWNGFSDVESSHGDRLDSGVDNDDGYEQYISRLASTSSEAESGNDDFAELSTARPKMSRYSPVVDTLSTSQSRSSSDISYSDTIPEHVKSLKPAPSTNIKATTFLPTLMGGYYSGSESGYERDDRDDDDNDPTQMQPRRNRMGQQARRQLWEKKFGQKANHIKTQSRDQGWDARKGARGDEYRGKRGRGRGNVRSRSTRNASDQHTSGANSDPIKVRASNTPKVAEGPLHPSWEAAKKAKEQKMTAAFEGKKIVFD